MAEDRFRFGSFDFDAGTLELRKGERPVRLRPQALKLLRLLVARPRQLVSREEIHRELWGDDVFVDFEQGVNHSVKLLRAALGDDADQPRYIETLPRRGYRFIAPIDHVAEAGGGRTVAAPDIAPPIIGGLSGAKRWALLGGALAVVAGLAALGVVRPWQRHPALPASATLAVLPFRTLGMPSELHYLGASLADGVIARLTRAGEVRVRPMVNVLPYESGTADFRSVGQTLQVDYILAGTVRRDGDRDRINLQIVDSGTAQPVWRDTADVPTADPFALEVAISDLVVSAFATTRPAPGVRGSTEDAAAYQAYLQGRYYLARLTRNDTLEAAGLFERALATDSTYALAHAGLALASVQMAIRFASEQEVAEWQARGEQHARRALELESTLAEAHEALAEVARHIEFDWARAIEQSLQALRLNPGLDLPHYYLAGVLQHIGRLDLIEAEVLAGLDANPLNLPETFRLRGMAALWGGRFGEARTHLERLRDLTSKPVSDTPLAEALYHLGETAPAEAMLRGLHGSGAAPQRAAAMLASMRAAQGDRKGALELVDEVLSRTYMDHHVAYSLGATYAGLGQPDQAFRWLRQAANTGLLCHPWYRTDPLLAPLRSHKDFDPFLDEVKTAADRIASGYRRQEGRR